jgi:NADPH:quinone reductase-like Zn-dependent oxidoreductase
VRALRFSRFGPPSVLELVEVAPPVRHDHEALVRVKAAAVHPSDVKNVAGEIVGTALPRTPGRDFAGIVLEGKDEGREVWSSAPGFGTTRDGAHAELVTVPEEALSPRPRGLPLERTAAIGVPFLTAWHALVQVAGLEAGETILIVGAGGAVGQAATEIASWRGARVIGAGRGSAPIPGVAATIDTGADDVPERVHQLTDGKGADLVLDAVGGAMFEPALRSLRYGGRQVAITSTGGRRVSFDLVDFYHRRLRLFGVDSMRFTARDVGEIAALLRPGFEAGALEPSPIALVPFEQAVLAYERTAGGHRDRIQVLTFS